MVITKLMGGLGNQLFQYAFGRSIALKNNCGLKFDLSYFESTSFRKYELHHFKIIAANPATVDEIEQLKQKHFSKLNTYKRKLLNTKSYFVHEKSLLFNPHYFALQKDAYVDGYWQSEKYFIDSSEQIRKEFQFKNPPSPANQELLSDINATNAISIHIRRTDYVDNGDLNIHGVCSVDYYHQAIELMANKMPDAVFYFFSDDIAWVRQHLNIPYNNVFVDINDGDTAYEDLRLMLSCKHHIIANSSFSWWGAWLNPNPDKIVIAPKKWFANPEMDKDAKTIVPDEWIRL